MWTKNYHATINPQSTTKTELIEELFFYIDK
jgi:hypothetical protein